MPRRCDRWGGGMERRGSDAYMVVDRGIAVWEYGQTVVTSSCMGPALELGRDTCRWTPTATAFSTRTGPTTSTATA